MGRGGRLHPYFLEWFGESVLSDMFVADGAHGCTAALWGSGGSPGGDITVGAEGASPYTAAAVTPYAEGPQVIRTLYGFAAPVQQEMRAVLLLGVDKTDLGNRWYPTNLADAERRLTVFAARQGWRIVR